LQLAAISDFASRAAVLYGEQAAIEALRAPWVQGNLVSDFAALKAEISQQGLPPELVQALHAAGADQQAVDLFAGMIVATPADLPEASELRTDLQALRLGLMGELAINDLLRAVEIRVSRLGAPVSPLTESQRTKLQAGLDEIEARLAEGVPSPV